MLQKWKGVEKRGGKSSRYKEKKSLSKLDSEDIKRRVRAFVDSADHGSQVKSQSRIQLFTIWACMAQKSRYDDQ